MNVQLGSDPGAGLEGYKDNNHVVPAEEGTQRKQAETQGNSDLIALNLRCPECKIPHSLYITKKAFDLGTPLIVEASRLQIVFF